MSGIYKVVNLSIRVIGITVAAEAHMQTHTVPWIVTPTYKHLLRCSVNVTSVDYFVVYLPILGCRPSPQCFEVSACVQNVKIWHRPICTCSLVHRQRRQVCLALQQLTDVIDAMI